MLLYAPVEFDYIRFWSFLGLNKYVIPYLQNTNYSIRAFAIRQLTKSNSKQHINDLLPLLHDPVDEVVETAITALRSLSLNAKQKQKVNARAIQLQAASATYLEDLANQDLHSIALNLPKVDIHKKAQSRILIPHKKWN